MNTTERIAIMSDFKDALVEETLEAGGLGESLKKFLRAFAKFLGDPRLRQVIDFLSALLAEKAQPPGGVA